MAIVRWTPFQELDSMERQLRRAFEEVGFAPTLVPPADVYETDDEFIVELEVPGYEEKELAVEVSDHTLRIKGERTETTREEKKDFRLRERLERHFERRFSLPADADPEHLKATFGTGVLKVRAPKVQTAKPRKVQIAKG